MDESTPVTRELDAKQISYTIFRHTHPPQSLEQAAVERGQRPGQVIRSILFRVREDEYVMVMVGGPRRLSWPTLREHLGVTRMTMATPEEVLQVTGYLPGAVAPFGIPRPVRVLVDFSVLVEEEISLGSGVRGTAIIMKSQEFLRALGDAVEIGGYAAG